MWRNRRAFLLVEATLTATIIAVGLVFVSRAIASSLQALSRVQAYHRLLRLADQQLEYLELHAQQLRPLDTLQDTFAAPDEGYQWSVKATAYAETADGLPIGSVCSVVLSVSRMDQPKPQVQLSTLWPSSWLASGC